MPQITHILFDCDNTLVLSEDLAFEACAEVANQVLQAHNIPDRYTGPQLITDFVGMNFRGMMKALSEKYNLTISPEDEEAYVKQEEDQVIATLSAKAQSCANVDPELESLAKEKKYKLAVVSSSAKRRVVACLQKVGQDKFFPDDVVFSAATSLNPPTSKPNPAIYIHACKELDTEPGMCVAVEDSVSGTKSAVAAGIPTIGYVGSYHGEEKQKEMSEELLKHGAKNIMVDWTEFRSKLAEIENGARL
jgi:HAD superfamily hydrolase (TIGR01509 family)